MRCLGVKVSPLHDRLQKKGAYFKVLFSLSLTFFTNSLSLSLPFIYSPLLLFLLFQFIGCHFFFLSSTHSHIFTTHIRHISEMCCGYFLIYICGMIEQEVSGWESPFWFERNGTSPQFGELTWGHPKYVTLLFPRFEPRFQIQSERKRERKRKLMGCGGGLIIGKLNIMYTYSL